MRKLAILAALPLCLAPAMLRAQDVRGRVVDEPSRRPMHDVAVRLTAADGTVIDRGETNSDGFFRLRAGRAGELTLTVERSGYTTATRTVRVEAGQDLMVPAFVLRSEAFVLDSVSVEAARRTTNASRSSRPAVLPC